MQDKSMTKKAGRPELPEKERRSVVTQFRCTAKERDKMEKAASQAGMKLSDWLRNLALG